MPYRTFLTAFVGAVVLTPLAILAARRLDIMDHPSEERKVHERPTPLLGGVAIYLSFTVAVLFTLDYDEALKGVLVGSTIIFFMGLIDDMHHIRAAVKLVGQIVAALCLVKYGVVIDAIRPFWLSAVVTVLAVVGLTNALNFLDNMDGLCAGIAAVCGLGFAAIAVQSGQPWLSYLAFALVGSSLGFLIYNFKPARVFMGDAGSTFLGFTLSSLAVIGDWAEAVPVAVSVPVLVVGILIFDTTLITILRIKDGKVRTFRQWIEHADTDHTSHRLVGHGMSQVQAVLTVYASCGVLSALAVWIRHLSTGGAMAAVGGVAVAAAVAMVWLDRSDLRLAAGGTLLVREVVAELPPAGGRALSPEMLLARRRAGAPAERSEAAVGADADD